MNLSNYRVDSISVADCALLRTLEKSDVSSSYVAGLNDPLVNRFLHGARLNKQTEVSVRQFVDDNMKAEDGLLFGFFLDGLLRGTVRVHGISMQKAHIGLALFDRSVWGQGWGRKIIKAASDFVVLTLGVVRIEAGVYEENFASRKAFEGAGYKYKSCSDWRNEYGVIQIWEYSEIQFVKDSHGER